MAAGLGACGTQPSPPPSGGDSLAIGVTEPNPALKDELSPAYHRLLVNWRSVVRPDGTLDLAAPQSGCMRDKPPCLGWAGLRAQLRAFADRELYVVIYDAPDGAPDVDAYSELVRAIQSEADVAYWAPWNEPHHRSFLDVPDPAATYSELARAMQEIVGDRLVIGELGPDGLPFLRRLPETLVCGAAAIGQHDFAGGADPLPALEEELARCPDPPPIWITETGGRHDRMTPGQACAHDARNLIRWYGDASVEVAFHYTVREDDLYPTGLVSTDLAREFPALDLWRAWADRDEPGDPPPAASCSTATAATAPAK